MLADIASGNTNWADVMFLIGLVLGILAAILFYLPSVVDKLGFVALSLAVAAVAFGFLLL